MSRPKRPLPRPQVVEIAKRLVSQFAARRDVPLFYKVLESYPDAAFWTAYQPDFVPDSMVYYLSAHGKAAIETAISVFHLDMEPKPTYHMEQAKVGPDAAIQRPKKTMADILR